MCLPLSFRKEWGGGGGSSSCKGSCCRCFYSCEFPLWTCMAEAKGLHFTAPFLLYSLSQQLTRNTSKKALWRCHALISYSHILGRCILNPNSYLSASQIGKWAQEVRTCSQSTASTTSPLAMSSSWVTRLVAIMQVVKMELHLGPPAPVSWSLWLKGGASYAVQVVVSSEFYIWPHNVLMLDGLH